MFINVCFWQGSAGMILFGSMTGEPHLGWPNLQGLPGHLCVVMLSQGLSTWSLHHDAPRLVRLLMWQLKVPRVSVPRNRKWKLLGFEAMFPGPALLPKILLVQKPQSPPRSKERGLTPHCSTDGVSRNLWPFLFYHMWYVKCVQGTEVVWRQLWGFRETFGEKGEALIQNAAIDVKT